MTLHRLFSRASLPVLALVAATAGGCNLDLEDLLDNGMDTDGDTDGDTGGSDDGDASHGAATHGAGDDGAGDDGAADGAADDTGGNDGAADTTDGGVGGGEVPAELLGAWVGEAEGTAMGLEFYDDGSYGQVLYAEYDDAGCDTIAQEVYAGTLAIDGESLVLTPVEGYQSLDQCGSVSEDSAVPDATAVSWSLGTDDQGDALTLDDGSSAIVLHRSEGT